MGYATREQFEAYVEGWSTDNEDALDRLLERASFEVDRLVGPWPTEDNGLKFGSPAGANEKDLSLQQQEALSRATCAQAEHMFDADQLEPIDPRVASISGPDFSTSFRSEPAPEAQPLADKALQELRGHGLIRTSAGW